jgi:hypothetical protein
MKVEADNALRGGATWARIIGTNGRPVADMDVRTKKDGNGWFAFNTTTFMKGGPVTVYARMAIFDERRRAEDDDEH